MNDKIVLADDDLKLRSYRNTPNHLRFICRASAVTGVTVREGRTTKLPEQLGQTQRIACAHFSQKVHSKEQI